MANTEQTFADIYGRAIQLSQAVATFVPAFSPADTSLVPATFLAWLGEVNAMNQEVDALRNQYSAGAAQRTAEIKKIRALVLRAINYVKSNAAWNSHLIPLKSAYDLLRGYRAPAAKPIEGEAVAPTRNQGRQSHSDLESLLAKFNDALERVPGYVPPAPEISVEALKSLHAEFSARNATLSALDNHLATAIRQRRDAYGKLKAKAQAIKKSVVAQYGPRSSQQLSIGGMRF